MKFQPGQKVICVDATFLVKLKVGEIYTVESCEEHGVRIKEVPGSYFTHRFEDAAPVIAKREFDKKFDDFLNEKTEV